METRENGRIRFTIDEEGRWTLSDGEQEWRSGRVALQEESDFDAHRVWHRTDRSSSEQYPGRFSVRPAGSGFDAALKDPLPSIRGHFHFRVDLDGDWVVFDIDHADAQIASLSFPAPLESDAVVLPEGVGRVVRQPEKSRRVLNLFGRLNMRFFGGLAEDGDHGWIAIFEDGFADGAVLHHQKAVHPLWMKSLGKWEGHRRIRYRCTKGGYVGIAKAFREWAKENGLFVSLDEKISRFPDLERLKGGRILSFMQARPLHPTLAEDRMLAYEAIGEPGVKVNWRHADVRSAIDRAAQQGIHGLAVARGWIKGGYDESHPDIWPPEPELGTEDDLRELCRGNSQFTVGLHDNYQDVYPQCPSFPDGVIQNPQGEWMAGGEWAGGQAYILQAGDGLRYLRRNLPKIMTLEPKAFYIDTVTATQLYEDWEPGHKMTRTQDVHFRSEQLAFLNDHGLITGSEESADFGIPYLSWFENRHRHTPGESVPLWPLVFGDAAFNARYLPGSASGGPLFPLHTPDMLWGYVLLVGHEDQDADLTVHTEVDRWNAIVAGQEMIRHRYLDDERLVEETTWANGARAVANFGSKASNGVEPGRVVTHANE